MVLGLLAHVTPSISLVESLGGEALVQNSYFFQNSRFFVTKNYCATLRFSYKHCNFSRVCLLVKMASKTVTRSILWQRSAKLNFWSLWSEVQVIMALGSSVKMKIMTAGLIPKARRSNGTVKKNLNYHNYQICSIFRFARQTFLGGKTDNQYRTEL